MKIFASHPEGGHQAWMDGGSLVHRIFDTGFHGFVVVGLSIMIGLCTALVFLDRIKTSPVPIRTGPLNPRR